MRTAFFFFAIVLLPLHSIVAGEDLSNILGVTHVNGKYFFTRQDFLDEGADQVLAVGSKVIKLYMTGRNPERYSWNSTWPDAKNLVEMASHPYFRSVFSKAFRTYILTAYALGHKDAYWTNGVSPEELADETRQFYDLTKYLMTTYKGTGKTFVLQHWEGDWALRDIDGHTFDQKFTPLPKSIDGMIAWLNARQAGIRKAREELRDSDVHVYGATEANRVVDSMAGKPGVANSVLPHTTVDLVSYSSWDSQNDEQTFAKAIDFLAAHLPPTAAFGQNTHSVYVGEFGGPESSSDGIVKVNRIINNVVKVTREKQMPLAVYWEIYCNELLKDAPPPPITGNNKVSKGHWMVKPDGRPGVAWHRYRQLLSTEIKGDRPRVELESQATFDLRAFEDDQTRVGAATDRSPLTADVDGNREAISIDSTGAPVSFDWTRPHKIAMRLDHADGNFAAVAYYVDDAYAGSWLYRTGAKTLDNLSMTGSVSRASGKK